MSDPKVRRGEDYTISEERQAIIDCVNRFSWAIDTLKPLTEYPDAFKAIFTDDFGLGLAREQVKNPDDVPVAMGRDAFAAFVAKVQGKYNGTQHVNSNFDITLGADGTTAHVKTMCTNFHQLKDNTRFDYHGVYDDSMVKTAAGWRIKTRKQYPLFMQGAPAPVTAASSSSPFHSNC